MENISIKKNYIYNTLYQILTLIVPLITTPYISRIFEADGIGIQSYTNSIVTVFILFASFGTAMYGQREIARNRNNRREVSKLFWEIELINIIATSVCLIVWTIFILIVDQYKIFYLVLSMQIIAVAFDISWFYAGYERFKFITLRNALVKLIGIVMLFTLIKTKDDLVLYVALTSAITLFGNMAMWTYLKKFLLKVNYKKLEIKRHFKQTLVYFIPTLATSVYTVLDKTMIGIITQDNAENGYYEQATKIINMAKTVAASLNTVMYARMSYMFARNEVAEMKKMMKRSLEYIFFISIPMILGIDAIATKFVPWFFGEGYDKVAILLYFYSPLILIVGLSGCIGTQYLTPSGQRARTSKAIIVGAVINFTLNICMIPFIKSIGAAIASVIAETVIVILYVYMSDKFVTWKQLWMYAYKKIISGIIMFLFVVILGLKLPISFGSILLQIICGASIYVISLIILKDEFTMEIIHKIYDKFKYAKLKV